MTSTNLHNLFVRGFIPPKATIIVALTSAGFSDEDAQTLLTRVIDEHSMDQHNKRWSDEDHALMLELFAEGVGVAEIARRLKRTAASVYQRLCRFGIKRPAPLPKRVTPNKGS